MRLRLPPCVAAAPVLREDCTQALFCFSNSLAGLSAQQQQKQKQQQQPQQQRRQRQQHQQLPRGKRFVSETRASSFPFRRAGAGNTFESMRSRKGLPQVGRGFLLASLGGGGPASCRTMSSSSSTQQQQQQPVLRNVSASDYPTPAKYLENPDSIPTYYTFQSNMVSDEDLVPGMLRNLEVDRRLTLPTRTHIRFLVTATDVIHSWAVPALGIKADAIPGRLQRVNTFIQREGVFYGQCSELCGALHGFMPIVVEAVSPETYAAHARKWYKETCSLVAAIKAV
ncbi:hypothetical protein Esti_003849 [Eimeria stiedai]